MSIPRLTCDSAEVHKSRGFYQTLHPRVVLWWRLQGPFPEGNFPAAFPGQFQVPGQGVYQGAPFQGFQTAPPYQGHYGQLNQAAVTAAYQAAMDSLTAVMTPNPAPATPAAPTATTSGAEPSSEAPPTSAPSASDATGASQDTTPPISAAASAAPAGRSTQDTATPGGVPPGWAEASAVAAAAAASAAGGGYGAQQMRGMMPMPMPMPYGVPIVALMPLGMVRSCHSLVYNCNLEIRVHLMCLWAYVRFSMHTQQHFSWLGCGTFHSHNNIHWCTAISCLPLLPFPCHY